MRKPSKRYAYVLMFSRGPWKGSDIVAVFSTWQKAEQHKAVCVSWNNGYRFDNLHIVQEVIQ